MDLSDAKSLANSLSNLVTSAEREERASLLRAFDAALSVLNSRVAIAEAARWFLDHRVSEGAPAPSEDFWASHITPQAAAELQSLVPRFAVLYGEHRKCNLLGNTGVMWVYSTIAIMPEPIEKAVEDRLTEELFEYVVSKQGRIDLAPRQICYRASAWAPKEAVSVFQFEHEFPDARYGHCMMRLEIDGDEAVLYWPGIDDSEYNFVDIEVLSETCERLDLRHVLPMQLAAFFTVISCASADLTDSWGGEMGASFFEPWSVPSIFKILPDEEL